MLQQFRRYFIACRKRENKFYIIICTLSKIQNEFESFKKRITIIDDDVMRRDEKRETSRSIGKLDRNILRELIASPREIVRAGERKKWTDSVDRQSRKERRRRIFNFVRRPACRPAILKLTGYPESRLRKQMSVDFVARPVESRSTLVEDRPKRGRKRGWKRVANFWQLYRLVPCSFPETPY